MAGAGYKVFNTGDVLLASEVNTYLMQQTVMVFDDATARSTAIPSPSEGMFSYLKDTNLTYRYDGSAWLSDAGTTSPLTTKGDLWSYSTTDARLGVGSNGDTLLADSAAAVGLSYQPLNAAGKNLVINGAMLIDQRATTTTINAAVQTYTLDRWRAFGQATDGVFTVVQDSDAPSLFAKSLKVTVTTADASIGSTQTYQVGQAIEGFNTIGLAWGTSEAKSATLSFWVKSSVTGTFGGSIRNSASDRSYPFSYTINSANTWEKKIVTILGETTGTWAKDSSAAVRLDFSLGGGTDRLGTAGAWNTNNNSGATGQTNLIATVNATWFITGVQFEIGSVPTSFTNAGGTLQGELAACQRYYYLHASGGDLSIGLGANTTTAEMHTHVQFPVTMRTAPTLDQSTGTNYYRFFRASAADDFNSFTISRTVNTNTLLYNATEISGTTGDAGIVHTQNASAKLAFTAEL